MFDQQATIYNTNPGRGVSTLNVGTPCIRALTKPQVSWACAVTNVLNSCVGVHAFSERGLSAVDMGQMIRTHAGDYLSYCPDLQYIVADYLTHRWWVPVQKEGFPNYGRCRVILRSFISLAAGVVRSE